MDVLLHGEKNGKDAGRKYVFVVSLASVRLRKKIASRSSQDVLINIAQGAMLGKNIVFSIFVTNVVFKMHCIGHIKLN